MSRWFLASHLSKLFRVTTLWVKSADNHPATPIKSKLVETAFQECETILHKGECTFRTKVSRLLRAIFEEIEAS